MQLSEHAVPFCDPRGGVHHLDVRFVAVAADSAAHAVSDESLDVRWWPADDLPDPQPDMVELVGLARATRLMADVCGRWPVTAGRSVDLVAGR